MTDLRQVAADLALLREDVDYLMILLEPSLTDPSNPVGGLTPPTNTEPAAPNLGSAHVWRNLTVREAARAWDALTGWVDWLIDRYRLDDALPRCWYRHGAMVDELDALRATWTAAYLDPAARSPDASYWLDQLHRTLERIREWDRYGCTAGTHHEDTAPLPDPIDSQEREEFVFADINARARARRHETRGLNDSREA